MITFLLLCALAAVGGPGVATQFERDVRLLASDRMEGRGLGTHGIDLAADWIESQLRARKLQPAFGQSYRQPFQVKTGVALAAGNRLSGVADDDWTPLGMSSAGAFSGEVAFVGYGISAPALSYDDYAGIDLKGKVALMLRYEPQERDENSPFDGKRPSRWSAVRYKILQARERGAVAVIFVTGPLQDEPKDRLPVLKNDGPESPAGLPVLQVRTSVAQKWVDLAQFQKDVDSDLKPRSRVLAIAIDGCVAVQNTYVTTANLAAILPGRGKLAQDVVVLGAHYDHLGYGGAGTWMKTSWLGVPLAKCPLDLWVYQELLRAIRPQLVIETGTAFGGSALFLANMFDLIGGGEVISIDLRSTPHLPKHPRITYFSGSSTSPEIVQQIRERAAGKSAIMVILDSDHRRDHVLAELRIYGPLVTPGSYMIVEDTNVNGRPVLPGFGPGPAEAIDEFLRDNSDFAIDGSCEKFLMTFSPGGFLKKQTN